MVWVKNASVSVFCNFFEQPNCIMEEEGSHLGADGLLKFSQDFVSTSSYWWFQFFCGTSQLAFKRLCAFFPGEKCYLSSFQLSTTNVVFLFCEICRSNAYRS